MNFHCTNDTWWLEKIKIEEFTWCSVHIKRVQPIVAIWIGYAKILKMGVIVFRSQTSKSIQPLDFIHWRKPKDYIKLEKSIPNEHSTKDY